MDTDSAAGRRFQARIRELLWYRQNVPCMEACPVHTDSGRYVQFIAEEKFLPAFYVARNPNALASVCGRICAAPCEDACRRGWIDEAVTIRSLKRFVTERYGPESSSPETFHELLSEASHADPFAQDDAPGCERAWHASQIVGHAGSTAGRRHKVAVIGSGPAGIACAYDLALSGYAVTVFEALPETGGMLRYGIPDYRLPRPVLEREIGLLEGLGVEFRTNTPLTPEFNLRTLREQGYEAFFLAVGAMQGRELSIPGVDKDGVIKAVDYLLNINRGYRVDLGKRVIVIGGGSVALDAARSAVRDFYKPMEEIEKTAEAVADQAMMDVARGALRGGATEVFVVSLESLDQMPAARTVQGKEELEEALEEGIELRPSWGPIAIRGEDRVEAVDFAAVVRVFDENGRFAPLFDESNTMTLEADSVVLAIGQQPDLGFLAEEDGIELTRGGTIRIEPETLATTAPGVFAGGDAAFGPRIVIEAVANGKLAARSIRSYLEGAVPQTRLHVQVRGIPTDEYRMPPAYEKRARRPADRVETGRRTGITEVENVFTEEQARSQAERCLSCHVDTIYDPMRCVLCGRCADVCPEKCLVFVPLDEVEMPEGQKEAALAAYGHDPERPLTALVKDDTSCIRCGLCATRCPTEAMTMERFSFVEMTEPAARDAV